MSSSSSLRFVGIGSAFALTFALMYGCTIKTADDAGDGGKADGGDTTDSSSTVDGSTADGSDGSKEDGSRGDSSSTDAADDASADAKADARRDGGDGSANACMPQAVTSVPAYVPSPRHKGVCTPQQLADFRYHCYGDAADADCETWATIPANENCYFCEGDVSTKSEYGLITGFRAGAQDTFQINLGGWIQSLDPSKQACAEKLQAVLTCKIKSCATACPLLDDSATDDEYFAAEQALDTCLNDSAMTTCKTYFDQTACLEAEQANPLLAPIFNYLDATTDDESNDAYFQALAVMCGAPPGDGGTDSGSSDAAADGD